MPQSPSSSSRRKSTPGNSTGQPNKTGIGCMSGLLNLFSRRHSRRRIPYAVRKEMPMPALPKPEFTELKTKLTPTNGDAGIISGDVDGGLARRSPTLPLEIRRSGCFFDQDSPRRSSALLARLMGLEEPPVSPPPPKTPAVCLTVDSAEEKRRTLLGALERCDEDLRALKLIIDAIRTVEMRRSKIAGEQLGHELKCVDGGNNGEQPSPVSVLDAFSSPKSRSSENASSVLAARSLVPRFLTSNGGGGGGGGGAEVPEKKAWTSAAVVGCSLKRRMMADGIPRFPAEQKGVKDRAGSAVPAAAKEFSGSLWQLRWRTNRAERNEGATVIAELADDVAVDLVNSLVMEQVENCW
ncbi:hypothetical protein KSP39_PZI008891 [Platanthera zijinensis]|uniref:DUF3741 domain-containing protein n=1 Tax=Platanthera zijinensis TaxID=2320716 RepID=A0AAP0BK80_9ASPA